MPNKTMVGFEEKHGRHAIVFLIFCALLTGILFPLTAALSGNQDGDGILTSLMSTQKLTWYFWGQDRLLNLFPALTSPLNDVEWNLRIQIFLRSFSAYLSPLGILVFLSRSPRILALSTAMTNVILLLCLRTYAQFNFYVQHNTFGISLTCFAIAFLTLHLAASRSLRWAIVIFICSIAYATNYALLIYSLPAIGIIGVLRWKEKNLYIQFFILNCLAIAIAHFHSIFFGEAVTQYGVSVASDSIISSLAIIKENLRLPSFAVIALFAIIFLAKKREENILELIALLFVSIGMIILLSNTIWVQINKFNIRYFLTSELVYACIAGYIFTNSLFTKEQMARSAYAIGGGLLAICMLTTLGGFNSNYKDLIGAPWRETSRSAGAVAKAIDARVIIGGFWDVWPAVFEAERQKSDDAPRIYGATYRGQVLQREFLTEMKGRGAHAALCFYDRTDTCTKELVNNLQIPQDVKILIKNPILMTIGSKQIFKFTFEIN